MHLEVNMLCRAPGPMRKAAGPAMGASGVSEPADITFVYASAVSSSYQTWWVL